MRTFSSKYTFSALVAFIIAQHASPEWWSNPNAIPQPFAPCQAGSIINCTVYHMATLMLRSRAQDFAVAAFWPTWAAALHAAFHNSSAPLLLRTSAARAWLCGGEARNPPMLGPGTSGREVEKAMEARKVDSWEVRGCRNPSSSVMLSTTRVLGTFLALLALF